MFWVCIHIVYELTYCTFNVILLIQMARYSACQLSFCGAPSKAHNFLVIILAANQQNHALRVSLQIDWGFLFCGVS